ncbi:MAG: NAD(P)-dependent alcohol dehydrogenase [Burkholderiaceae bacterium]
MKRMILAAPGGLERLRLTEVPEPAAPAPHEIRVRVAASSLNFHDFGVVSGARALRDGLVPLSDGAGVVDAVGSQVEEFAVGDAVVSTFFPLWADGTPTHGDFSTVPGDGVDGYACEVVVRPASWFTRAPAGWSSLEAATLTTAALTAWRALVGDGGLCAGQTVLTLGSGGVSVFALQFAKAMGARVIVTSSSDEKLARLRQLGADATINYEREPNWSREVMALTEGRGVDQVIELGGAGTLPESIASLRVGGLISLIGTVAGVAGEIPTAMLMRKQGRIGGLIVGSRRQQQQMVRALEVTGIRPVIDRSFALADLADAFRYESERRHLGKIGVRIAE